MAGKQIDVNVNQNNNQVNLTQNTTNVVEVKSLGPKGDKGDKGDAGDVTGSLSLTGSLTVSSSFVDFTNTTVISGSIFSGSFVGDGSSLTGIVASATPGGSNTNVQFNDGGTTNGSSDFTFDKSSGHVTAVAFSGSFSGSFVGDGSGLSGVVINNGGDSLVQTVQGTLKLSGDIVAENYILSSSVTYMTQSFSSGSTIFGDTLDDTHQFTGSVFITGSINVNSNITASGDISSSGTVRGLSGSFKDLTVIDSTGFKVFEINEESDSVYIYGGITSSNDAFIDGNLRIDGNLDGVLDLTVNDAYVDGFLYVKSATVTEEIIVSSSLSNLFPNLIIRPDGTNQNMTVKISGSLEVSHSALFNTITASGDISSSGTVFGVTGSFSHLVGNSPIVVGSSVTFTQPITGSTFSGSFVGDGSGLSGVVADGTLSSSAQIATDISGAFTEASVSFSDRVTNNTANIANLESNYLRTVTFTAASGGFSTRITTLETQDIFSGSFSGSFVGDGSGLTGISSGGSGIFTPTGSFQSTTNNLQITGSLTTSGSFVDFTNASSISGSTFSGSFVGDGSGLTGISSGGGSGIFTATGSFQSTTNDLQITGSVFINDTTTNSGSGEENVVFKTDATAGRLFTLTNDLSDELFTVNDISGITVFKVSGSGEILLKDLPTTEPNVTGSLWISGSSAAHPSSGYLMIFKG